jgi:hypothetical protein
MPGFDSWDCFERISRREPCVDKLFEFHASAMKIHSAATPALMYGGNVATLVVPWSTGR